MPYYTMTWFGTTKKEQDSDGEIGMICFNGPFDDAAEAATLGRKLQVDMGDDPRWQVIWTPGKFVVHVKNELGQTRPSATAIRLAEPVD